MKFFFVSLFLSAQTVFAMPTIDSWNNVQGTYTLVPESSSKDRCHYEILIQIGSKSFGNIPAHLIDRNNLFIFGNPERTGYLVYRFTNINKGPIFVDNTPEKYTTEPFGHGIVETTFDGQILRMNKYWTDDHINNCIGCAANRSQEYLVRLDNMYLIIEFKESYGRRSGAGACVYIKGTSRDEEEDDGY